MNGMTPQRLNRRPVRGRRITILAAGHPRRQLGCVPLIDPAPDPASAGERPSPDASQLNDRLRLAADSGDVTALDELLPTLFDELRALAHRQLAGERGAITLQTTELVHEAYLRLLRNDSVTHKGRAYFFAAAARAMRQVLVDAARRRLATKRGTGVQPLSLDEVTQSVTAFGDDLLELDAALRRLEEAHPRHARVVECRFFGGLTVEDTAAVLGVSARTVKTDWALARAWLYEALREPDSP